MESNPYDRIEGLLPEGDELGIDGLQTIAPIGEGGFGRVFRARQLAFNRDVAVKVLSTAGLREETARRFERECRAVGTLSGHPNIVTMYDSGINRWGRPYIVMDHMSGGSFADLLSRSGPIEIGTAVDAIIQIAGAVETAHRAGILHRDIKPENLLLSGYGEPKLADFGIAAIPGGYQTHTGAITASLAHAAPEVLEGNKATRAVDVYALGSTLFALVSGEAAFHWEDGGLQSLIARTLTHPVPDLRPRGVANTICEVIEKAMAKDPSQRFGSVEEFGVALQGAQAAEGAVVTQMSLEGTAVVTYPAEPLAGVESATQLRERRELTPPQPLAGPRRVIWRSPVFAAALVLSLAAGTGGVMAIRAQRASGRAPATQPLGQPQDAPATASELSESRSHPDSDKDDERRRNRRNDAKKRRRLDAGRVAFGGSSTGGSYPPPLAGGTDGAGTAQTQTSSSSVGGSGSDTGSTSGGSGGGEQPDREPEPIGSEMTATLPLYYHWSDDGSYFFTTNRDTSMAALSDYDHRLQLGSVWSSTRPGDDLAQLCFDGERCEGYVAKQTPKSGSYKVLYWHPGGEDGRFFSTNSSATYRGQSLTMYGYIR